jgi:hypothetical protein
VLWLAAAREGLDDNHAAAGARAWRWQHTQLISLGGSVSAVIHRDLIITLAAQHKLPAVYFQRHFVAAG